MQTWCNDHSGLRWYTNTTAADVPGENRDEEQNPIFLKSSSKDPWLPDKTAIFHEVHLAQAIHGARFRVVTLCQND